MCNCCTTLILGTKTQNSINKNLFKNDFKEVLYFIQQDIFLILSSIFTITK